MMAGSFVGFVWSEAGGFEEVAEAGCVPVGDRSFLHGLGVFETVGVHSGRVPLWSWHWARLRLTLPVLGLDADSLPGEESLVQHAIQTAARSGLTPSAIVRVTVSTGGGPGHRIVLGARPLEPIVRPVRVADVGLRRAFGDPTARWKTTSRAFWHVVPHAADDVLALGAEDGAVLECGTGNLFVAEPGCSGAFATPPLDGRILPGVGRAVLLDAAARSGVAIEERPVRIDELRSGFVVVNAARGPRSAVLVDGDVVCDNVQPVDFSPLTALWNGLIAAPS